MAADLTSKVFRQTFQAWENPDINIIVNEGGTRSGKTYSVLQLLALIANASAAPLVISVVTQTFPQLRQGAMRDFEKVINELPIEYHENKSTHTWEIGCSIIEFFSADQYEKVLGSQRSVLFVNEANRLGYEVVRQLMVRTSGKKFFDYNPVSAFWMGEHILSRPDAVKIHSTYKDNAHLAAAQIAEIESHKTDTNWWRVYGLGLEGRLEGLVYPDFDLVDAMPEGCRIRYGIDFGFNDPAAVVRVGIKEKDLYLEQICYKTGLVTEGISRELERAGVQKNKDRIIGDSEALVQIEELYRMGWNIHSCKKGPGSIVGGIQIMKGFNIHILKNSPDIQTEALNYMWEKDRNDKILEVPCDTFNHALDACRYAVRDLAERSGGYSVRFV